MFRAVTLPIIRSFPLYMTGFMHDQDGGASNCHQTCMTYTSAECTGENSRWWAEQLPETCRVSWQK